ncbi:CPCC family cysteine-rich protein [Amycolatopsis rifamycinica]|uniref:Cysteine-rich CPCC domain-containing protein n=1 Tax=Amycolatopsis rifamycinica TaxID=287986 RepID=A0A066U2A7_9PSEU|nr:CPCC family cysteine-rich protein [Amycolatopsis rifamycinica]KDN20012.1 hypothetical protein DV20_23200 [Amycolatopsis rifamycinica]
MDTPAKYPCPCCGHRTYTERPGSYEICSVCFWEDDDIQLRWPDRPGGANSLSLIDAQRAYAEMGAMEYRFTGIVRMAAPDEPLDDGWRPIDLTVDDFEPMGTGHAPWPADPTALYWWRPTFWRRRS